MSHEIVSCSNCGAVIWQCRCPGPHHVRYVGSNACRSCNSAGRQDTPVVHVHGQQDWSVPLQGRTDLPPHSSTACTFATSYPHPHTDDKPALHPFDYVKPTDGQAEIMKSISSGMRMIYDQMIADVAPSAERTLAIRKLQEARMWTNVALLGITLPR